MEQASAWSRREVWTRKLLYPGHTFPTAIAPVAVGIGLAHHDGVLAAGPALLAFVAGWLIQFAGVVTDNYTNLLRQPDDREHAHVSPPRRYAPNVGRPGAWLQAGGPPSAWETAKAHRTLPGGREHPCPRITGAPWQIVAVCGARPAGRAARPRTPTP